MDEMDDKRIAYKKLVKRYGTLPKEIFERVQTRHDQGQAIDDGLFAGVAEELGVSSGSQCRYLYYEHKKLSGLPTQPAERNATGRHMFLLQKWGLSALESRELVNQLLSAAGHHRAGLIELLYSKMENRVWYKGRKIEWLRLQADKMVSDPFYLPSTRKRPNRRTSRERVIDALRHAPQNQATRTELSRMSNVPLTSLATLITALIRAGDVVHPALGVYALPQGRDPQKVWRPAREDIMSAFARAPDRIMTLAELMRVTGRTERRAVAFGVSVLERAGKLVRIRPGVFALPAEAHKAWRPARKDVLRALEDARKNTMTKAKLIKTTGRTRQAVGGAIVRLVRDGQIVRIRRGVFFLPHRNAPARVLAVLAAAPNNTVSMAKLIETTDRSRDTIRKAVIHLANAGKVVRLSSGVFRVAAKEAKAHSTIRPKSLTSNKL